MRWVGLSSRAPSLPAALEKDRRSFIGTDQPYYGPEERSYSEKTAAEIDEEVKRIVEEAFARSVSLLQQRRESLDRVARTLLEKETLEESELTELAEQTSPGEGTQVRTGAC